VSEHAVEPVVELVDAPWSRPATEVVAAMTSSASAGLSHADATARLERYGRNEIAEQPPVPRWRRLMTQFTDPLVLLLLAAIVISLLAWLSDDGEGAPLEAIVIAAIVIANASIGYWQESKAIRAVAALRALSASHTSVIRDGEVVRIVSAELVPGDIVLLAEGDAIGADARLIDASTLYVLEASLTGESAAVAKQVDVLDAATGLADRTNMAFKGTAVSRGRGVAVVMGTGMATEIGRIARLLDSDQQSTPLQRQIEWLGRRLGVVIVVLAVGLVVAIVATGDDRSFHGVVKALLVGVSLAVAAVPEGLPAILSVVLALGVQRMAAEHAIVKRLSSVETLGSASVICTDKTGTLTRNEMTVVEVVTAGGAVQLTGVGYVPVGEAMSGGHPMTDEALLDEVDAVLRAGGLANDATLRPGADGKWVVHGDPTEIAFLVAEEKLGLRQARHQRFERVAELPFTSERRRMTTLHHDHHHQPTDQPTDQPTHQPPHRTTPRVLLSTKGAPDVVLERCVAENVGGDVVPLTDARRTAILADVERLAGEALRTIAVAVRDVTAGEIEVDELDEQDECDLVYLGVVGIFDPPRPEAAAAIADAHAAGVRVIMITGDHPLTAARIGARLGLAGDDEIGVTGAELSELDPAGLAELARTRSVFARVAPEHKLQLVDALQADGQIVAMTGDGVNDAPALRRADIGVAMGVAGTEVAKEAADVILTDDNFATIIGAVREGRQILSDIRKVLRFLFASNAGEVLVMVLGVLAAGALGLDAIAGEQAVPLLATQILWINLLTDAAPAIALGVDPAVEDVMHRPPRPVNSRVIDREMVLTIGLVSVTMAVAGLIALDLRLSGGLISGDADRLGIDRARTMVFTTIVLAQVCNAFNARSDHVSAFVRPFENRLLWAAVALTVSLQVAVVHLPGLQHGFRTAPLDAVEWAWCIALGSTVLWVDELRKLLTRRRHATVQR
jgi:magnesium-transporting ATPase (P-type)